MQFRTRMPNHWLVTSSPIGFKLISMDFNEEPSCLKSQWNNFALIFRYAKAYDQ